MAGRSVAFPRGKSGPSVATTTSNSFLPSFDYACPGDTQWFLLVTGSGNGFASASRE